MLKKPPLTAIDCFSGCGGLSEGLRQAGFKVLAGVEIRSEARAAHKLNHPSVQLYADITKLDPGKLMFDLNLTVGQLDLLAGCPPCQGFSTMRTRNGAEKINDPRNKLIFDFIRLAVALRPKTILMENVPALLTDWRLRKAKKQLKDAGYEWMEADVRNAAHFEVPQRRRRMILMASRLGLIELPKGDSVKKVTVENVIGNLEEPADSSNRLHRLHMRHSAKVMDRIRLIPKDGGSRSALGKEGQLPCHKNFKGFRDVYGRMKWNDVAPTITRFSHNPSKGRFLHPKQDRAITVYEALLLQSFPATYNFPLNYTMSEIASLIGEALPPQFAKAQATHLKKHLLEFSGSSELKKK